MEIRANVLEKLEKVSQRFPSEAERLQRCAESLLENDSPIMLRALEKQIDLILTATTPTEAREYIDQMEKTLANPLVASVTGKDGPNRKTLSLIGTAVVIGFLIVFLFSIYLNLYH